jgi:hypothetical protein
MTEKQNIPDTLRQQARERAQNRCEYCLLHEDDAYLPFEVDHIIAERHGGVTLIENLAWACALCNRYKGTDLASVDPQSGRLVALFHPRRQQWRRHFHIANGTIEPLTAAGRATVRLLRLNQPERVLVRTMLIGMGRYPAS